VCLYSVLRGGTLTTAADLALNVMHGNLKRKK
jgi:hypothetical protein